MGGLPRPEEAGDIWSRIWHEEAHNSTAIEGNTLVLREVEQLLKTGQVVGRKELKEYLEVKAYAEAAKWVYEQAHADRDGGQLITLQEVRHIHSLAVSLVWEVEPPANATPEESPGNWRRHNIEPFEGGMRPPDHTQIPALMADWIKNANAINSPGNAHVVERVARLHADFECIHPFLDGNGRAGRLLMNLLLVRMGYPPLIIRNRVRRGYLRALHRADRGDAALLGELLARAILENLMRFVLPAVAGDVKLLPLESLVTTVLTLPALRNAAQRGRLRAVRSGDGSWRSSKQWVREYRKSRWSTLKTRRKTRSRGTKAATAPSN